MDSRKYMAARARGERREVTPKELNEAAKRGWGIRYGLDKDIRPANVQMELHGDMVNFGRLNLLLPGTKEFSEQYYPPAEQDVEAAIDIAWEDNHEVAIWGKFRP